MRKRQWSLLFIAVLILLLGSSIIIAANNHWVYLPFTINEVSWYLTGTPTVTATGLPTATATPLPHPTNTQTPTVSTTVQTSTSTATSTSTGTPTTTTTVTVTEEPELFDSVLYLDGFDDYATTSDSIDLDIGDDQNESLTIEGWINITDIKPSTEMFKVVVHKEKAYSLQIQQRPNQHVNVIFKVWINDTNSIKLIIGTGQYLSSGWHHVAGIFDNSNDELRVYYDGERIAASTSIGTDNINSSAFDLFVGDATGLDIFDGQMEEIRLSDSPRYSGKSIDEPDSPFSCDPSTRALWHFDEASGAATFYDGEDGAGSECGSEENTLTGVNGAQTGP